MPAWLGWLVVAAVLGVVEVTTLAFAAGLVACAALVAAVVAGLGGGLILQALVFGVTSFAALAVVYPICPASGTSTRRRTAAASRPLSTVQPSWSSRLTPSPVWFASAVRFGRRGLTTRPR
jgi:membrane protein implicated in regulation of membrane protease activity